MEKKVYIGNDTAGHYYAYTKDFKTFETEPQVLFGRWNEVDAETGEVRNVQCIDGDIIYNEKDGYYYLYFKEAKERFIKHPLDAVSVGDIVDVKVMSVDLQKKRIQLTMVL